MIGVCTRCHNLYDFVSEEAAYEPDRICGPCYRAERERSLSKSTVTASQEEIRPVAVSCDDTQCDPEVGTRDNDSTISLF